jgi:hypothetical protein
MPGALTTPIKFRDSILAYVAQQDIDNAMTSGSAVRCELREAISNSTRTGEE